MIEPANFKVVENLKEQTTELLMNGDFLLRRDPIEFTAKQKVAVYSMLDAAYREGAYAQQKIIRKALGGE